MLKVYVENYISRGQNIIVLNFMMLPNKLAENRMAVFRRRGLVLK